MTIESTNRGLMVESASHGGALGEAKFSRAVIWPFGLLLLLAALLLAGSALHWSAMSWVRHGTAALSSTSYICQRRLLLALILMVLSYGLMRRRQVAFYVTLILAALGAVMLSSTAWTIVMTLFSLALALCRNAFYISAQAERLRTALKSGLIVLAIGVLYIQLAHYLPIPVLWVTPLALLASLIVLVIALRSAPAPKPANALERARAQRLLQSADSDTLAPFALRHDKAYVFSPDGRAAIGYRVLLGVAVAGGDPVGDCTSFNAAVNAFIALCQKKGWEPAALGVRADHAFMWQRHRLNVISIGDEVLLDIDAFTLVGRRMLNVRQTVAHTKKVGVTTEVWREGDLSADLRAQLEDLSKRWLSGQKEHGFSMILDGLLNGAHPDCTLIVARDKDGCPVGFQRYVSCRAGKALSLDVMRRDRQGPSGLNERMIVGLIEHARLRGVQQISLNFAAFRPLLDAGAQRRGLQKIAYQSLHLLDPFIQVESLYRFNAKFHPSFVERTVVLPSWVMFPAAVASLLGLEFALPYDRSRYEKPETVVVPVAVATSELKTSERIS
jgi:lysylphosphatidylglycerol synthetase-like protein (DUF2156 family)